MGLLVRCKECTGTQEEGDTTLMEVFGAIIIANIIVSAFV
tara:strand:- start:628 stop:747 length:120 start_codon:yes stop_codon:yes gene_type:complete